MTFIVTLIALLIERFFDWGHLRQWHWFSLLERKLTERFANQSPYIILVCLILPLPLFVGIIELLIYNSLYGFIRLLFQLLILLYCLGPQNFWADAFACINALVQGDAHFAADKLKYTFGIAEINDAQSLHRHLLDNIFIEANRRVFAVIFWFVVLGPVGAVLYRVIILTASRPLQNEVPSSISQQAQFLESILDWIPARILTFLFALGGHFVHVLTCWRKQVLSGFANNESLLTRCGMAALLNDHQTATLPEDGSIEKQAISLVDRSLIIALVIILVGELLF